MIRQNVTNRKIASKKATAQSMDTPPASPARHSNQPEVKPVDNIAKSTQVEAERSSFTNESTTPPLPREREANQPAITAFFSKSPRKTEEGKEKSLGKTSTVETKMKPTKRESVSSNLKKQTVEVETLAPVQPEKEKAEDKAAEKVGASAPRKMMPRKSTRGAPGSSTPEKQSTKKENSTPIPTDPQEDPKSARSPYAPKTRKQGSTSKLHIERNIEEEMQKQTRKRKSEIGHLDSPQRTETRTRQKKAQMGTPPQAQTSAPPSQEKQEQSAQHV